MKACCQRYKDLGLDYCGVCEPMVVYNLTRGRKKRKRKPGAGSAVKVGGHTRTPRGSNKGKKKVRVDGYRRGKGRKKKRNR